MADASWLSRANSGTPDKPTIPRTPSSGAPPSTSATGAGTYGLLQGSPSSALKRGSSKGSRLSRAGSGAADGDGAQQDDDAEPPVVSRKLFDQLRSDTLDETISEAGSDEEEQILLDEEDQSVGPLPTKELASSSGRQGPGVVTAVGQVDKLTFLRSDTPIKKMRCKEKEAKKAVQGRDPWGCLRLRQEILGIAKLYSATGPYRKDCQYPMMVSEAHFNLAKAYADLQCVQQANDHCKKAVETMPTVGEAHPQVVAFEQEVNVMQAEMLLMAVPPKPQAALQYILVSEKVTNAEGIQNMGIKVLAAQCYALMGMAKLQEAYATRTALEALQQRVETLSAKLEELNRKTSEYERVLQRIRDAKGELKEEEGFEALLLDEARTHLDRGLDLLMSIIHEEEPRIKAKLPEEWKTHPLIVALWRQCCEISFKSSLLEGLAGNNVEQLTALNEVLSANAEHSCVPVGLLARVYKEKGAAMVAKAGRAEDEESRKEVLNQALEVYDNLLQLQSSRYQNDGAKQATLKAEAVKLIGNVYVALRHWNRAQEHFQEAIDIYASYLGPDSNLVLDLEHRIQEVQGYIDGDDV